MSTKRRTSLILESHETDEYDSEIKHIVMKFFGTFSQFDHTFFLSLTILVSYIRVSWDMHYLENQA